MQQQQEPLYQSQPQQQQQQQQYPPQQQQPVQYVAAPAATAVVMQPPVTPWNTGLCDCCQDGASCCEVYWCPWCQLGYQYNQLLYPQQNPKSMHVGMCFGSFCGDVLACAGSCVGAFMIRSDLRARLGVAGDGLNDCCASFWCTPCVICQSYREMTIRGAWPGGLCVSEAPPSLAPKVQTMIVQQGQPQQGVVYQQQQAPQQQQQQQYAAPPPKTV